MQSKDNYIIYQLAFVKQLATTCFGLYNRHHQVVRLRVKYLYNMQGMFCLMMRSCSPYHITCTQVNSIDRYTMPPGAGSLIASMSLPLYSAMTSILLPRHTRQLPPHCEVSTYAMQSTDTTPHTPELPVCFTLYIVFHGIIRTLLVLHLLT